MDYRRANRAFLFMMVATVVMEFMVSMWAGVGGSLPVIASNLLCETIVLLPAVAAVLYSGDSLGSVMPLKGFKLSSALLSIVYMFALLPLTTLLNSISMLFVDNVVAEITPEVVGMPMWTMILTIGIISPFIEEIVFRGFFFHTYKKSGRILASAILSSVLFGMMHMNFNQFAYAAVLGVMFSILVEATGSVLSSFLTHGLFNSLQVVYLYMTSDIVEEAAEVGAESILPTIGMLLVMSIIFTPIAFCIVYKIAKLEGREVALMNMLKGEKKEGKLVTFPLIVAMVISVGIMTLYAVVAGMQ